jgi:hypothetical protein
MANQPGLLRPVKVQRRLGGRGRGSRMDRLESALVLLLGSVLPSPIFRSLFWGSGIDLSHIFGGLLLLRRPPEHFGDSGRGRRAALTLGPATLPRSVDALRLSPAAGLLRRAVLEEHFFHLAFMLAVFWLGLPRPSPARFRRLLVPGGRGDSPVALRNWQTVAFSHGWPTGIGLESLRRARAARRVRRAWRSTATSRSRSGWRFIS